MKSVGFEISHLFLFFSQKSFQNIRSWLNEIDEYSAENVSKVLVGNKSDLKDKRAVSNKIAQVCDWFVFK